MKDAEVLQVDSLRQFIDKFKSCSLSLNAFNQKAESVLSALSSEDLAIRIDQLLVDLEVINAVLLDERRPPTGEEKQALNKAVTDLEELIETSTGR